MILLLNCWCCLAEADLGVLQWFGQEEFSKRLGAEFGNLKIDFKKSSNRYFLSLPRQR